MDFMNIKPQLKRAYPTVFIDNNVYVGGFGTITKYTDTAGAIELLFEKMDGNNTISEIVTSVKNEYSQFSEEEIIKAINGISEDGFLEDKNLIGSEVLSEYELSRYHRNINFFSSYLTLKDNKYKLQKKLSQATIGIIGLGGLGSHIVYDLAGLGIGTIKAVEFDKVDISNLNRQILYDYEDIGISKAELAKKRIIKFNPKIKFYVSEKKIQSANDVENEFKDCDLLILVADRPKTLLAGWVNEAIVKLNIPLFCAGLEAQRAMHYTIIPHQTGCIECWKKNVEDEHPVSHALLEERRRLNLVGDNTAIVPLVSTITGFICAEIVKYLTGIGELTTVGKLKTIDFSTMTTVISETWEKNKNCQICGNYKNE
ncbi:TPA: ThiF family adenylyltransferase [Enterococcus faecalis]